MLLWLIFAVVTTAVLVAVLRPAFRSVPITSGEPSPDLAVYTDQLADLERQVARGQLDEGEHAALRHEISRRILRLAPVNVAPLSAGIAAPNIASVAAIAVPLLCLGLYVMLGAPTVPGRPFKADAAQIATASAAELVAKVEARLASNPQDGRGWDAIAPIYFRMQRYADASGAYGRAIGLQGETPQRLAGFAEATVLANDGIVTEPARTAYLKLRASNPDRFEPRFWLALADEQNGNRAAAAAEYRALLAAAPIDVTWRRMVEQRLAAVVKNPASARGPSEADVKASESLTDAERSTMIAGMVENLAARLKLDGADLDGWQRLIRSYVTLKKPDQARAALASARSQFAGDTASVAALDALARGLELQP